MRGGGDFALCTETYQVNTPNRSYQGTIIVHRSNGDKYRLIRGREGAVQDCKSEAKRDDALVRIKPGERWQKGERSEEASVSNV